VGDWLDQSVARRKRADTPARWRRREGKGGRHWHRKSGKECSTNNRIGTLLKKTTPQNAGTPANGGKRLVKMRPREGENPRVRNRGIGGLQQNGGHQKAVLAETMPASTRWKIIRQRARKINLWGPRMGENGRPKPRAERKFYRNAPHGRSGKIHLRGW